MDLQRIGFKFFVDTPEALRLAEVIPVFHRWIQAAAVDGLLIDVADYQHVEGGPGVMLIAHEGNYALDLSGGRLGMLYSRKHPSGGTLAERLVVACRTTLRACRQLEVAPELDGRVRFRGDEFVFLTRDRLLAPNSEETQTHLAPALSSLLAAMYGDARTTVCREPDPRELFALTVTASAPAGIAGLLARLGG